MQLLKKILSKKQGSIGSAAFLLMTTVLLSRILGLVRDRLLAGTFHPEQLGIYFAAFRLPNMLFELLVTGVLTTAFIPVFTRLYTKKGNDAAGNMASVIINYGIVFYLILIIPFLLFTDQICVFLAPGFSPSERAMMAQFTRLMIIFQVLPLMIGNFLTGILQSYQLFFLPALAPVIYNIGTIIGILLLAPIAGLYAPVIGISIGAFLFLLIQIPAIIVVKYRHKLIFDTSVDGVKEVARLMGPRTFGLAVSQIDTTADLMLASFMGTRMVTIFNFAQQLQQLPIGLFGATIAQAALPSLSRSSAQSEHGQFRKEVISAIHQILFFVLPVSVMFIVLRIPITRLVFGTDRFDWEATVLTGKTLSAFSISLFAQAMLHILARAFYALYDTKTPVFVGIFGILLNVTFSIFFVNILHLPVWALGLSTSIAILIQVSCLFVLLQKKVGSFSFNDSFITPIKIATAAGVMGIVVFMLQRLLDELVFDTTRTLNLILLVGTIGSFGLIMYLFLSWVFGVGQVAEFLLLFKKLKRVRTMLPIAIFSTSDADHKEM